MGVMRFAASSSTLLLCSALLCRAARGAFGAVVMGHAQGQQPRYGADGWHPFTPAREPTRRAGALVGVGWGGAAAEGAGVPEVGMAATSKGESPL